MIHEGMVLEYSGRPLGLIFWASTIKQAVFILLLVNLFIPWNFAGLSAGLAVCCMLLKVLIVAVLLACIETSTNKIRLFRVPGLMTAAGVLSMLALIAQ
jgi:formate hydrogenlyase subunit 4